jgi:hypothetical protein
MGTARFLLVLSAGYWKSKLRRKGRSEAIMSAYDVTIKRDGKYWLVYIDGVRGLTQAREYGEVETMAREYISLVADEDYDTVEITSVTVEGVTDVINQAAQERAEAKALEESASSAIRRAALSLKEATVPLAEIGQIIGVSHQRAHQLVAAR